MPSSPTAPAASIAPGKFVHLHNHSHYSLLDGLQKVPQMLDRAATLGMTAMALTDHGTLTGVIEFYQEAHKRGIKPIIGMEAYVAPRQHTDKTPKVDANPYHLILLAYNHQGYQNLMQLSSIAHLDGYYYKPRVDRELLTQYHDGLIALSGCAGGEVATHLRNGALDQARATAEWYRDTFGEGNYYLELQDHEHQWPEQKTINEAKTKLAQATGIPLVVTSDCHYADAQDREAHEVLLCVQTAKTVTDADRMIMEMDLFVSDPADIAKRWQHRPEALANTVKIAQRCDLTLELGRILIPQFPVPTGATERAYLHELTWQGLMWRYGDIAREDMGLQTEAKARAALPPAVVERVDYELGTIGSMGFDGYFLIVADFINWGKNRGIIFGPGRGSAAGSIVAYALNVTDLDPLTYDLLFERFLNPERISMPDIDIDIQDTRREEVIAYVTEKYGQDRVAQIITFGTMAARGAVRDVGRTLGYPYAEVDGIAKLIPLPIQGRHISLSKTIKDHPEVAREYNANPRTKRLIDLAIQLEGTIRSNGVHAAGVVITPEPIVNYTPLQRAQKGGISTQYSMGPIEDLGLLKIDFLGLSNLTIIKNTLRIVRKVYGTNIELASLPLDDAKTYELLARGDTTGVFQLESAGMKRYLRELKPTTFEDIVSMVALYRPGPIQWIDDFIERKHGRRKIEYLHPAMENALKPTYGVIVTQEQVMQISKEMCGFSGAQADYLRKAISKKKPKELAKMKQEFIEGGIKTVRAERALMELFWSQLEDFAAYCFNKAHSACYALIAYQTAYLKAHYPAAFMAALMTSDYGNIDRIAIEVAECKHMGLTVLPPDINESYLEFSVMPDRSAIRFGLSAIKNIGTGAIEAILTARESGQFTSVEDVAKRVNAAEMNRKVWESLTKTGALDSLIDRGTLLFNLDTVTLYAGKAQQNALSGQIDIFGSLGTEDNLPALRLDPPPTPLSTREQLAWEKELLGLYVSHHPLDDYDAYLQHLTTAIGSLTPAQEGKSIRVGGIITSLRPITTKNGAAMAFVKLADKTGELELIVFPQAYEAGGDLWQPDSVIRALGKVSTKDREGKPGGELKVLVDKAEVIDYDAARQYVAPRPEEAAGSQESGVTSEGESATDLAEVSASAKVAGSDKEEAAPLDAGSSQIYASIIITLTSVTDTDLLMKIRDILNQHSGSAAAYVKIAGEPPKTIKLPFKVTVGEELALELRELVGAENVALNEAAALK